MITQIYPIYISPKSLPPKSLIFIFHLNDYHKFTYLYFTDMITQIDPIYISPKSLPQK